MLFRRSTHYLSVLLLLFLGGVSPYAAGQTPLRTPNRNVPFTIKGPATREYLLGIPLIELSDRDTLQRYSGGKLNRMINAGTLMLFVDRLPYLDLPHQEWAKPYHRGKLKVLYINDTNALGEAAMLEQRGDMDVFIYCAPVYLDWFGKWEENTALVSFLEQRMRDVLAHDPDVIVANYVMGARGASSEGSLTLPATIHQMVLDRVKAGAGLVIIPKTDTKTIDGGFDVISQASPLRYQRYSGGKNTFRGSHPIVDGVPLNLLNPAYYLFSSPAPGADTPVWMNNQPFLGLGSYGAGRVVAFGYSGQRSLPDHPGDEGNMYWEKTEQRLQDDAYHWYEYGYSLLVKAIEWVGKQEPRITLQSAAMRPMVQGEPVTVAFSALNTGAVSLKMALTATVRISDYEVEKALTQEVALAPGENKTVEFALGGDFREGLHLIDAILRNPDRKVVNWASTTFTITNPITLNVKTDKESYLNGDRVKVTTEVHGAPQANLMLCTELWDTYGRLMLSRGIDCWNGYGAADNVAFQSQHPYHTETQWLLLTSWCKGPIRGLSGSGLSTWATLLNGGSGMDWYEPSMFNAGYTALLPKGAAIFRDTQEIKSGLDTALLTAQRRTDPVAVWQDMSNEYAGWLISGPTAISRWEMIKTVYAHGIKPVFVSGEQVEAGILRARGMKLLYLPHIVCISRRAAEAVRQYTQAGGTVIADYGPGAFDELGKPWPAGALDDVFGIKRAVLKKQYRASADAVPIFSGADPAFPLKPCELKGGDYCNFFEGGLQLTTGKALGSIGKKNVAPAFILNHFGKGHALLLNFFLEDYLQAPPRGNADKEVDYRLAGAILNLAGVKPEVRITSDDQPLKYFNIDRFRRGAAWYIGVLRFQDRTDEPDAVTVTLPVKGHVYELRSQRYLGVANQISETFKAGDESQAVKIYAVLPYRVQGVTVTAPPRIKRGSVLHYAVNVQGADGGADHALRVEVLNPQNRLPECYQQKVLAEKGRFIGRIPFALNDPTGSWQIQVTDVISGKVDAVNIEVVK
ncbi:MAG: hypothetical protein ACYC7E_15230 [Armatimonadota bacterium]